MAKLDSHDEDIVDLVWKLSNSRVVKEVEIARDGKSTGLKFKVHSLKEEELTHCRDQATYHPKERFGDVRDLTGELNQSLFHQWAIYTATEDDDKKRLWDNKAIWQKLNAGYPMDVIAAVLLAGELAGIYALIEKISGYGTRFDEDLKASSRQMTQPIDSSTSFGTEGS